MNRKHRAFFIVVLALTAVLAAWPARGAAQDVEIGALLGWNFPGLDTTYVHSFVPQFTVKPFTGSGGQTIRLQGISGLGLGGYLNIAMRDHWLLQFSYTPFSTDLQGSSSDYTVSVNYTASKPPDTPPQALQLHLHVAGLAGHGRHDQGQGLQPEPDLPAWGRPRPSPST